MNNSLSDRFIKHLDKIHKARRSTYGRWVCKKCNSVFNTRKELRDHTHQHFPMINGLICPFCNKEFKSNHAVRGHIANCKNNPVIDIEQQKAFHKKASDTFKRRYSNGEIRGSFNGRHHSEKSKIKIRESAISYLKTIYGTPCRYNKKSIPILEKISKEHGWNIQHAENGGEFYTGIGFFVDAYDREKNIVLEYDERNHYTDVYNNILTNKDLERQKLIIEHLKCEYWRYNETTGVLWKVI